MRSAFCRDVAWEQVTQSQHENFLRVELIAYSCPGVWMVQKWNNKHQITCEITLVS